MSIKTAIRGAMLSFRKDPFFHDMDDCLVYESDAVVVMENGKIVKTGAADKILPELDGVPVKRYADSLIIPGFIDCHVHYPQTEIIAAYGEQLIEWLNNYTFVAEQGFKNKEHADEVAEVFLREQVRNGVTSSTVYCTVFPQSVDAVFEAAAKYDMRIMAGKVCMDRNAPAALLDTPQRAYESKALISRWHGKGRAEYVITPRFVPTSTPEQMEMIGALAQENPDMLIQSHVSENVNEVAWVKELCPEAKDYTDAYARYGLMRRRAIYGHGIHLTDRELGVFNETGASVAHCPTSNFFLGSGCLNVKKTENRTTPRPCRSGNRFGRGYQLFHSANHERSLQSRSDERHAVQLAAQLLSCRTRHGRSLGAGRQNRQHRAGHGSGFGGYQPKIDTDHRIPHALREELRRSAVHPNDLGRRPRHCCDLISRAKKFTVYN